MGRTYPHEPLVAYDQMPKYVKALLGINKVHNLCSFSKIIIDLYKTSETGDVEEEIEYRKGFE